jgi:antirestriction protein ArdC
MAVKCITGYAICQNKSPGQGQPSMNTSVYQRITDQIIANLQSAGSWQKLWDVPQPVSLAGHTYTGINYLLLGNANYNSPVWGTFNQVRQNGGSVNKGERSILVVFWKRLSREQLDPTTGRMVEEVNFLLKYYNVFNTDQCTFDQQGLDKISELSGISEQQSNDRFVPAEEIIADMPDAPMVETGANDRACYIPSLDKVMVPDIGYFKSSRAYYSTMFHELVHSTGHPKRLNRFESGQHFGSEKYSREELVAELGAAFLCTIAGIDHDIDNTSAYIKSWLKVLSDNPTWITWAASRAQKACELISPALSIEPVGEAAVV